MKTNGLIGKKAKCARAAWRSDMVWIEATDCWFSILRWHQAQRGRK